MIETNGGSTGTCSCLDEHLQCISFEPLRSAHLFTESHDTGIVSSCLQFGLLCIMAAAKCFHIGDGGVAGFKLSCSGYMGLFSFLSHPTPNLESLSDVRRSHVKERAALAYL